MRTILFPLLSLALFCLPADAQQVRIRGEVEDVSGTQNQFFVDCSNVTLSSSTINLNAFISQQVDLQGQWNGSRTNPHVDVTSIQVIPEGFEIGGGAKIGGELRFHVLGSPGQTAVMFASVRSGFAPLGQRGSVLLDPATTQQVASRTIGGSGIVEVSVSIPNDPALLGVEVFGQAFVFTSGVPGSGEVTTNDCKEISN